MSALYLSADTDSIKTTRTARGHRHITAHARGWSEGVRVEVTLNDEDKVEVAVYRTGGSNGSRSDLVASWKEGEE